MDTPTREGSSPCFPSQFMKGVGISVWQNSSDGATSSSNSNSTGPAAANTTSISGLLERQGSGSKASKGTSNWYHFAKAKDFFGQAALTSAWDKSNDFWNQYETHIKLARALGTNSFRFSFEWARFEPTGPGQVDMSTVERYHAIMDCMIANGLEPMCTLHHFTHPQWFEEMGGFAKEENIPHFLAYCKRVFSWFGSKCRLWATFNEPTCFAFVGYIAGLWCPGKAMQFSLGGKVLFNLMQAHVELYKMLKTLPGGNTACIGIVHQHIRFIPKSKRHPHIKWLCKWMTYWFAAKVILKFFKTGVFEWKVPIRGVVMRHVIPEAPNTLDWWGINYYSFPCVSGLAGLGASKAKEPVSDNQFRVYPQGIYDSIVDASCLNRPIYITETGSADKDGKYRRQLIEGHCSMLLKAMREGYDVRGMYYWTLMDNIEWHEGFHMKFGLFEWDPEVPSLQQSLKLRQGSEALKEAYRTWPEDLGDMRAFAADKHGWLATQQLQRGAGAGAARSSNGTAAKSRNAWNNGKDATGLEPEERTYSSPGLSDDPSTPNTLDMSNALRTSSIRLSHPDSDQNGTQSGVPVPVAESVAGRSKSTTVSAAVSKGVQEHSIPSPIILSGHTGWGSTAMGKSLQAEPSSARNLTGDGNAPHAFVMEEVDVPQAGADEGTEELHRTQPKVWQSMTAKGQSLPAQPHAAALNASLPNRPFGA